MEGTDGFYETFTADHLLRIVKHTDDQARAAAGDIPVPLIVASDEPEDETGPPDVGLMD